MVIPGVTAIGELPPEEVIINAVRASSEIPPDAKNAFKDFVTKTFNDLWSSIDELKEIDPPMELVEYWEIILEILQKLI